MTKKVAEHYKTKSKKRSDIKNWELAQTRVALWAVEIHSKDIRPPEFKDNLLLETRVRRYLEDAANGIENKQKHLVEIQQDDKLGDDWYKGIEQLKNEILSYHIKLE